jgi:hypothetical protein
VKSKRSSEPINAPLRLQSEDQVSSLRGQQRRTSAANSPAQSTRLDTTHYLDCKIGHPPDLQQRLPASLAPAPTTSASPTTGGGYQPAHQSHLAQSSPNSQQSRKRNASTAELDSSPGSIESPEVYGTGDDQQNDGKRHPVKRACNECRQQKVSHARQV